jgi:hypothetical protein
LLASTLYSRAPAARRREIHRVIAKIIDDEEQRARHLALGADAPDSRIATAIESAAKAAARRGAPDVAADLLEDAARLTPARDVETRRTRLVDAAELYATGGDANRARHLLESLLPELPHGAVRARARTEGQPLPLTSRWPPADPPECPRVRRLLAPQRPNRRRPGE